jgi:subtilase family serine protease
VRRTPLLTLAALALVTPVLATGAAASSDSAVDGQAQAAAVRVCANPPAGFVACHSYIRTHGRDAAPDATTTYVSGYSPAQLKSAYGLTGLDGTTTIAVVDAYAHPNAAADLAAYRSQFNLGTANFTQYNQTGGTSLPAADVGWGQEEMLDLEMVSAICPSCPIIYVAGNSAAFSDLATAVNTAVNKGAKVVSNSYGAPESSGAATFASAYNHSGVAITVSSGDNGYGVEMPAAFNTVTAVGGTHLLLNPNGTRSSETVWSGAGSGCSAYIAKPSWQKDTGCSRRTVADVSAVADPNTGVAVYDSYGSTGGANWLVFGGTSVAAPLIGGVYGLTGSSTAGVPASLAYWGGGLFDVTSGTNGRCVRGKTGSPYLCNGVAGYDGPTGMGTPNGSLAAF